MSSMQFGKFLRKAGDRYFHYCPGCDDIHQIQVHSNSGPNWQFNFNPDEPDFKPSVKITYPGMTEEEAKEFGYTLCCHYFIDNGHLNYCADSTHELAGKSILLPELPEKYQDY